MCRSPVRSRSNLTTSMCPFVHAHRQAAPSSACTSTRSSPVSASKTHASSTDPCWHTSTKLVRSYAPSPPPPAAAMLLSYKCGCGAVPRGRARASAGTGLQPVKYRIATGQVPLPNPRPRSPSVRQTRPAPLAAATTAFGVGVSSRWACSLRAEVASEQLRSGSRRYELRDACCYRLGKDTIRRNRPLHRLLLWGAVRYTRMTGLANTPDDEGGSRCDSERFHVKDELTRKLANVACRRQTPDNQHPTHVPRSTPSGGALLNAGKQPRIMPRRGRSRHKRFGETGEGEALRWESIQES